MNNIADDAKGLKDRKKELYIYGTGLYGRNIYQILSNNHIEIDGFIVTGEPDEGDLFGVPVHRAEDVLSDKNATGIIMGMNRHNAREVKSVLNDYNIADESVLWGYQYIDNGGNRGGYDEKPTVEITTRIGCRVNCRFCPQKTLMNRYFCENQKRDAEMSLERFIRCLDRLPDECTILFSGMVEPFLNTHCGEMIEYACKSGHKVDLYTTLVGTTDEDIERICDLPIGFIGLHVADQKGYAAIPLSEGYYEKLERVLSSKKADGSPLVNLCNAQAEPVDKVEEICSRYGYHVLMALFDRAGNIEGEDLLHKKQLAGRLKCSLCGQKANHNILLPDGTLVLCCMDYGLQHVLGNLLESTYAEIMNGKEIRKVRKGMGGDESIDILCRHCSSATVIRG